MIRYVILNKRAAPVHIVVIQTGPRLLHILLSPETLPFGIAGKILGTYDLATEKAAVVMIVPGSDITLDAREYIPRMQVLRLDAAERDGKKAIVHVLMDGTPPETV